MVTVIAILPFLLLFIFLVILEKPAYIAGPVILVVTSISALFFWQMDVAWFGASLIRAFLLTIELMVILIGVLLLTGILQFEGVLTYLKHKIFRLSKDVRIQVILVSWLLVSFVEGIAGFGTPSMIAGPLLVALGFSPLAAVTTSLMGDAVGVTFGAVGSPMTIGIQGGVTPDQLALLGSDFLEKTYVGASLLHFVIGLFLPLAILCVLNYIYERSFRKAFAAWKFAFMSALVFLIPYVYIANLLGPEFPAILGSIIGFSALALFIRFKLFMPKEEWVFKEDDKRLQKELLKSKDKGMLWKSLLPYIIVLGLLFISRLDIIGFGSFLKSIKITFADIMGTSLDHSLSLLYSPGIFFLLAGAICFAFFKISAKEAGEILKSTGLKSLKIFLSLISILAVVQILLYSNHNSIGYSSFIGHLVSMMTGSGEFWPILSPFVGFFGAFLAGSSTVSNLMFSSVQVDVAIAVGMLPVLGLILQSIGSAAGNMIAVHNVIAASAVVHLEHPEGKVIKYNIIPALVYVFLAGAIVYLLISCGLL